MARKNVAKRQRASSRTAKVSAGKRADTGRSWAVSDYMPDFNPSVWLSNLMGSQTGRAIMAEVLVAAAAAAAAVLMAERTDARSGDGRTVGKAGRDTTALMKEAAQRAASAAGEVLSGRAVEAVGHAAKSMLRDGQQQGPASDELRDQTRVTRERNQAH